MSRPTKLTPEVQQRLCDAIAAGNFYRAACAHAGISYPTFAAWMARGRKAKSGPFREFLEAIRTAEARAELSVVTLVRAEIPGNWQAGLAFLARRFPKRWGNRGEVGVRHKGKLELAVQVKEVLVKTREEAVAVLELARKEATKP